MPRDRYVLRNRIALGTAVDARPTGIESVPCDGSRLSATWPLAGLALGQIGAGLPTAAYAHYRDELSLADAQVTALFAFLIVGVMLALWFCRLGLASSRRGPVLAIALLSAAVADLLFILDNGYLGLAAASGLLGCSVGGLCAMAPGLTTALIPDDDRASSWVTIANATGLAAGPVIAGAVNALAPLPYRLVYAMHLLLCALTAIRLVRAPAGAGRGAGRQVAAELPSRTRHRTALASGYLAFAVGGLVSSLTAVLVKDQFGLTSGAAAGSLIALFFAANAVIGGWVTARLTDHAQLIGSLLLVLGLVVTALAIANGNPATLVAAIVLTGGGQGALIGAGIVIASRLDEGSAGNAAVTAFFFWCYAGAASAAVTVGWTAGATGPGPAFLLALTVIVVGLLGVDLVDARQRRFVAGQRPFATERRRSDA